MSTMHKISILLIVLLFGACKKIELPPGVEEDPVFSVNATLDGEAFDLVAGEEEYYLFTSFAKDASNVFSFSGKFEKVYNQDLDRPVTLEFEIRDVAPNIVSSPVIEDALAIKSYPFVGTMMEADTVLANYKVIFKNHSNSNLPMTYNWIFSNGETSSFETPDTIFFPSTGNIDYSASLEVSSNGPNGTCFESVSKSIDIEQNAFPSCSLTYRLEPDTFLLNICGIMQGAAPFAFEWTTDSVFFGDCLDLSTLNNQDSIKIRLKGTDSTGCSQSINIAINQLNPALPTYCSADFTYKVEEDYRLIASTDSLFLSHVTIRYVDEEGVVFSTDKQAQPQTSNFEILESTDYLPNENGEKTRQLSIRFSVVLYNDAGDELLLENGTAIIAVAYP